MTKNLDNRKYKIIKEVMEIEDESSFSAHQQFSDRLLDLEIEESIEDLLAQLD